MRLLRGFVALTLLAMLATPARAEDEFRKHYEEGLTAYELGEFTRAAEAYKAAHRVRRDPALLYNIGQAYRLGGNLEQAVFFYRSYLRAVQNPPNRRELEERIKALDAQLAIQRSVASQPPNALAPPTTPIDRVDSKPTPTPKPADKPAPTTTTTTTTTAKAPDGDKPLHKKWWLWAAVGGGVVVAVGLGVGLGLGLQQHGPNADHSFTIFP